MKTTILLTAGGTGGHLFPAQALAAELGRRGYRIELLTDERADKYGSAFPADEVHLVDSETIRSKNPISLAKTALKLMMGTFQSIGVVRRSKGKVMVGFGGYPTFPPMFAARLCRLPTILHEANAVLGRANTMLARQATVVATTFPLAGLEASIAAKVNATGNPLRDNVLAVCDRAYEAPETEGPFRLLVTGGSQGARFFSDAMPLMLAQLSDDQRNRLSIVQQCRPEDLQRVQEAYDQLGVKAELASFFTDLPERIANAHLVVARAGAGTVCELAAIGRPSILVPLPGALDNDQGNNAKVLESVGGAAVIKQSELTPERFASEIGSLMASPEKLAASAAAAKTQGRPDAVSRLADLVEQVAGTASGNEEEGKSQ
ncbi:undecaprenyldiphospho-muramoylpentapeptide beta-N-acetylglucosaminyltransferase [Rhodobacteraceae bacterium RKSG542]|uniref:undecaprenyldiphospho-muramoylpentapeptide beta-N-acetylglucosaminyltransferase n=1 Tax=Pseudovibrio flavus TaxID=2529854 RepID=UPI0012BCC57C|nr:undecaprenyldiphospho-muramoylpentapeptide beta-N-acetylglucosaminyltransferase [Pseudovibrio flavus]MTI19144.1 undecaprenyldiphospho-muramoylpentapeptide beta-N-acetylglucosaminyltransferase [Pseudovibrio flavus]